MAKHKHALHSTTGWRRRAARTAAAVALLLGAAAVPALTGTASASGPLPTTTTITATPSTSVSGASVTLQATVQVLGLPVGLIVTPTGNVAFSFVQGGVSFPIATVPLASCPLSACTASTTTTKLRAGTTAVTAAYVGDSLSAASSGSAPVTVTPATTPSGTLVSTTCAPNVPCTSSTTTGGTSSTSVAATSTSGAMQTVSVQVIGGQLGCPGSVDPAAGVAVFFDNTASDAGKVITYTTTGTAGSQTMANYAAHPSYLGCYASPTSFLGYTSGVYGPATLVADDGGPVYKAQTASCATNGNVKPCFTFMYGYPAGKCPPSSGNPNGSPPNCGNGKNAVAPDRAIVTLYTPVGDPKTAN